jgi:PAS domain S-box-containing protein
MLSFLSGGGEAGRLLREIDWSRLPLGDSAKWPQALKALVSVMLGSKQAMFVAWGADLTLLYNDAYAEILGKKHPEAMGTPFFKAWAEIAADLQPIVEQTLSGVPVHMDDITLMMERHGYPEETHFSFSYTPVRGESGGIEGFFCPCTETTQQILAERKMASESERQRRLFEQAPGFITILTGPDHVFEFVNESYLRLFGDRGYVGRPVRDVFPDLQGQGFFEWLDEVYRSGERRIAHRVPVQLRNSAEAQFEERFLDFIYAPVLDDAGRVAGIFCEGHDVTEQVRAETAVRESEQRFRLMADSSPALIWVSDASAAVTFANKRYQEVFGNPAEDIEGDGWRRIVHPDDLESHTADFMAALAARSRFQRMTRVIDARGDTLWLHCEGVPRYEADGTFAGYVGVNLDVSEAKKAEAALRESEAKFLAIANSIDQMIWSTRPDGFHDYFNDRWYEYTGVPYGSTDGGAWNGLFHPDDQERAWVAWRHALETGERYHIEYRLRHRSGAYRWVIGRAQPVRDDGGRIVRWYGSCTDIHDLKVAEDELRRLNDTLEQRVEQRTAELQQAQEALRQSQKLEAMGTLTGGVAHDFNNLLTPIIGGLDMLQRRGIGDERAQRQILGALQSAERAKTLVQRLLAFARRQPLQPTAVAMEPLLTGMIDLIASTSGPRVKVQVDVPSGLPPARADANQLEMALLNLAVNARDAMPDGGTLTISAAAEEVGASHRAKLGAGRYIRLSVADTGAGMDAETLKRAVEPFFSTKGIGRGTGLGLSMVHGLALQLGGALTIDSRPSLGTNVQLWLPALAGDMPVTGAEPVDDGEQSPEGGTVLLVDDEDLVRASTSDMLAELGYKVVEVASAEEALKLIGEGLKPDLLVTDHLMPGMTGTELARRMRRSQQGLPVLVISGYAEDEGIGPDIPRLTKPFRRAELSASLAELTGA